MLNVSLKNYAQKNYVPQGRLQAKRVRRIFTLISITNVRCFPGGSEELLCDDMDAFAVLAICLRRRAAWLVMFSLKWGQKVRQHFLRKVFRVCGHFMCLTYPVLFLKGTSAGCFCPHFKQKKASLPADELLQNSKRGHMFSSQRNSLASRRGKQPGWKRN